MGRVGSKKSIREANNNQLKQPQYCSACFVLFRNNLHNKSLQFGTKAARLLVPPHFFSQLNSIVIWLMYMDKVLTSKITFSVLLAVFSCTTFAESWSAVGRHGECIPLEELSKRVVFLANVASLDDLKNNLEQRGLEYTLKPMSSELKEFFTLNIPTESVKMIITKSKNCKALAK